MVGGLSWGYVGSSWGYVGLSWGECGPILGLCWPILGLCWPILELCWPILGLCWPILGLCCPILRLCWSILRPTLAHVDPSWPILSHMLRKMGKIGTAKNTVKRRSFWWYAVGGVFGGTGGGPSLLRRGENCRTGRTRPAPGPAGSASGAGGWGHLAQTVSNECRCAQSPYQRRPNGARFEVQPVPDVCLLSRTKKQCPSARGLVPRLSSTSAAALNSHTSEGLTGPVSRCSPVPGVAFGTKQGWFSRLSSTSAAALNPHTSERLTGPLSRFSQCLTLPSEPNKKTVSKRPGAGFPGCLQPVPLRSIPIPVNA